MKFLPFVPFMSAVLLSALCFPNESGAKDLPLSTRFKGQQKFDAIVRKAQSENWAKLPISERMVKFGKELHGTPYVSFTLEIDNRIEAPSANFNGLDCWTFFETCLGLSRMIAQPKAKYTPHDLLAEIQFTRYRGGKCTGNYLERIHYLSEWFFENEARGVADNITRDLGGALPIRNRKCQEMTILWKSYRYLKNNPGLRPEMGKLEAKVSQLPVYYVPQSRIASIEKKLKNGDIIGVVTKHQGGFCSHVGIVHRTGDGVTRMMHASSQRKYRRVINDSSVSNYIKEFSGHIGIIVARPQEIDKTVKDFRTYRSNLKRLTGGKGLISMSE